MLCLWATLSSASKIMVSPMSENRDQMLASLMRYWPGIHWVINDSSQSSINPFRFDTGFSSAHVQGHAFQCWLLPAGREDEKYSSLPTEGMRSPVWWALRGQCLSPWWLFTADLQEVASPNLHLYWWAGWTGKKVCRLLCNGGHLAHSHMHYSNAPAL